jgi:S1-C subfamily serine protease
MPPRYTEHYRLAIAAMIGSLLILTGTFSYIIHDYNRKIDFLTAQVTHELSKVSQTIEKQDTANRKNMKTLDNNIRIVDGKVSSVTSILTEDVNALTDQLERLDRETSTDIDELSDMIEFVEEASQRDIDRLASNLANLDGDFALIVEDVLPSVVSVKTNLGQGSGFFVDNNHIATNYHVIEGAQWVQVVLSDGTAYNVNIVDTDRDYDIAVLEAPVSGPPLEFADIDDIAPGQKVVAIGNPYGLSFSVTQGIISGLDRRITGSPVHFIQTDTPINRGNSGGPIINADKRVIGIATAVYDDSNSIGFAIPADEAEEIIEGII